MANTSMFGPPIAKWFWWHGECPSGEECRGRGQTLAALSKIRYKYHSQIHHWMDYFDDVLFAEGMILRDYDFDKYLQKDEDDVQGDWSLDCQASARHQDALSSAVSKSIAISKGVHIARDLGNEPANVMYPEEYAKRATDWAKANPMLRLKFQDYARLQRRMYGVIAVGKGSERKPAWSFRLNPTAEKNKQVPCIVGKGITFDTGGISIKPSAGMWDMKFDMHGLQPSSDCLSPCMKVNTGRVNGITCMAENMPSAGAYRPGDVINTYSGKTIEVLTPMLKEEMSI